MPSISYREFASRIKSQYPQLQSVDDLEIAKRIVSTKPELKGKVFFGDEDPATLQAQHDVKTLVERNQPRTITESIAQSIPQKAYDFAVPFTNFGLRSVPFAIGSALAPVVPLAPVAGAYVGELAGQAFEKELGGREKISHGVAAAEGVVGGLTGGASKLIKPATKLGRTMVQGLENTLFGGVSPNVRSLIEKGKLADFKSETLPSAAFSGALGFGAQGLSELAQARKFKLDKIRSENAALEAEAQALSQVDNQERGSFSTRPVDAGRIEKPYAATTGIPEGAQPLPPSRQIPERVQSSQTVEKAIEVSASSKVKPAKPQDVLTEIEDQPIESWIERHMGLDPKTVEFIKNVQRTSTARKAAEAEKAAEPVEGWAKRLFAMPKNERGSITILPLSEQPQRTVAHGGVGGKGASVEELNRPGVFYKVGRSGVTYLGKQVDSSLKPGEAVMQAMPDGGVKTYATEGLSFTQAETMFGPRVRKSLGERGSISIFPKKKQTYQLSPDEQKVDAGFTEPPKGVKGVTDKLKAGWNATIDAMTDRSIYTKRAQDIVEKEHGGPLPQIARAREEALRWPGRLARVEEELNTKISPHLKALDSEEFQAVKRLIAAEDAITKASATNNQNRSYSGGVNWQEAQQAILDMQKGLGAARYAKVEKAAQAVFDYNHFLLKKDLDSGNITQALYGDLTTKFQKYNRVRVAEFIKQSADKPVGGAAEFFVNSDTGLRKLSEKGTSRRMLDPLESMIMSAFETENRVAKNDVANAIASWKQLSPTMDKVITRVPSGHKFTNVEAKMQARFDGKLETYSIPKELEGIFKYGTTMDGKLARGFSIASGKALLEAGAVRRNPLFLTTNALVDATQSMIRGLSPKDLVRGYISAFKNDKWAKDAKLAGATMGTGFYSRTPKDILSEISSKGHLEIRDARDLKRFADLAAFGWVSKIGEKIENAPRIAAFRKEMAKSGDELKSAIAGRDITVDFARGGWLSKIINQAVPFFNVGVQGALVIPRQLAKPEGRNRLLAGMAGLAVVGTGLEAYNRTFESYKDIPQYIKDAGLVFMLKEKKSEDGKTTPYYLNLNLREFAPVMTAVREGFNKVYGDEGKSIPEFIAAVAESGMPVKGQGLPGKAAQLIPPSVKAPIQVGFNKDFYRGRDINPPDEMRINTPEDRFGPYQTGAAKWLSKHGLGKAGLSPRDIESIAGTMGGGGAMQAMREVDNVSKVAKGEVKDVRDMPGLSSFVSQVYKSQGGEQQSRKYKAFTKDSTKLTRETLKEVEKFEEFRQLSPAQQKTIQGQISSRADKMVKFSLGLLDKDKADEYDGPTTTEELLDLAKDLLAEIE